MSEEASSPAMVLKDEGNAWFAKGECSKAVDAYTEGLKLEPESHVLLSNRAAAYLKLAKHDLAVKDAKECVRLAPDWPKGFTRLAQALYRSGALEECKEAIVALEKLEPENRNVKSLRDAVKQKQVFEKLRGKWHGQVAAELGGYMQTFNFLSESQVAVSVFDRELMARLKLDCSKEPGWLDLLVQQEPGAPPAPEVKHIFKLVGDELHLCSPYMTPPEVRPTSFEGPAFVVMKRGDIPVDDSLNEEKTRIDKLSDKDRVIEYANKVFEILPDVNFTPEMEAAGATPEAQEAMLATVRFQNNYYKIKTLYGEKTESTTQDYLMETVEFPDEEVKKAVSKLRQGMVKAGMMPSEEDSSAANNSNIEDLGVPTDGILPTSVAAEAPSVVPSVPTPQEKKEDKSKSTVVSDDTTSKILAVGAIAIAVVLVGVFISKNK